MMTTTTITLGTFKFKLVRCTNLGGNLSSWDVLSEDKKTRYGVVYKKYTTYIIEKFGWRQHKKTYWVCECFANRDIWIGKSRLDVLINLYRLKTPNEVHKESALRRTFR